MSHKHIREIECAEISSICDLSCSYCPHPTMERKKQFMSLDIFTKVCQNVAMLSHVHKYAPELSLHQFGEHLLHPQLEEVYKIGQKYNIRMACCTNCKILKTDEGPALLDLLAKYHIMCNVSEHIFKSAKEVHDYVKYLEGLGIQAVPGTATWLGEERGENHKKGFYHHKWLTGNRKFSYRQIQRCGYLSAQMVIVQADGRIVSCCADAEGDSNLGNIMDPNLDIMSMTNIPFKGCETCTLLPTYWLRDNEREEN